MIKRKQCKMNRVEEQNQNGKKKKKEDRRGRRSKQWLERNESVSDEGTTSRSLWVVRSLRN